MRRVISAMPVLVVGARRERRKSLERRKRIYSVFAMEYFGQWDEEKTKRPQNNCIVDNGTDEKGGQSVKNVDTKCTMVCHNIQTRDELAM